MTDDERYQLAVKEYVGKSYETRVAIARTLYNLVLDWRRQAGRYFFDARYETDAIGKKYYTSYAMALANCASELEEAVNELAPSDLLRAPNKT